MTVRSTGLRQLDVALVHDYLNQHGGAERVVLELSKIWADAPIYTSIYRPTSTLPEFGDRDVRVSFLDRIPVDRRFRTLFPLYPVAFSGFDPIDAQVVIASSSGWAHMAPTAPGAYHVVYCHTPARWLYGGEHPYRVQDRRLTRRGSSLALAPFRWADKRAARRADLYIANSEHVRKRITRAYGLEAAVVHPPVDTSRFHPTPRGERLLVISRLLPYKHVDLIVRAAGRLGIGLDVVGTGPMLETLQAIAGPYVAIHGQLSDQDVVTLMENCSAVCVAAEEDFGLVAVEAQAAGKPVVAYAGGGSLETVEEGVTGVLFADRTVESVAQAIEAVDALPTSPDRIALNAERFSTGAFRRRLEELLLGPGRPRLKRRSP